MKQAKSNLEKAEAMASFKIQYLENRNAKKPLKMKFDERSYYHQFLEEETVKDFVKNLNKKSKI
jgi:hypothetical protein